VLALTLFTLWLAQAPAAAPTPVPKDAGDGLVLDLAVHTYHGDKLGSSAGNSGLAAFESFVWSDEMLCSMAASGREPRLTPAVGWHFTGRVLQRTGNDFLVQIEWQRLWDAAARVTNGPNGSLQVTMHPGDRLELDRVAPLVASACQVASARLEATIEWRPARPLVNAAIGRLAGASAAASGGGTGRAGSGAGGADAGARPILPIVPVQGPAFDAELWLVHQRPDGTEEVQQQTLTFGGDGTHFAFPPVPMPIGKGSLDVEVGGVVRLVSTNGQPPGLQVTIYRHLKGTGSSALDNFGDSSRTIPMPAPSEVISFELPQEISFAPNTVVRPSPVSLIGHQFSLRVRVSPRVRGGLSPLAERRD
jgi:hypothetical protein